MPSDLGQSVSSGAVYVLSLPSFTWHKQSGSPQYARYMHSCNVIGQRQMVSVGGISISASVTSEEYTGLNGGMPDPFENGFGIFDLTEMEWKPSYNASADIYATPNLVKDYIKTNGRYPASWTNDIVEKWFTEAKLNSTAVNDSHGSGAVSTGTIVGIAFAAVACVGIIALLAFLFW